MRKMSFWPLPKDFSRHARAKITHRRYSSAFITSRASSNDLRAINMRKLLRRYTRGRLRKFLNQLSDSIDHWQYKQRTLIY